MDKPLHRCWTKATNRELGLPRYSHNWVTSRRGWLRVFADRLQCGDWVIPAASVTGATLYSGGFGGHVLVIVTTNGTFQFGLNPWCHIEQHLPFPVTKERLNLRYSRYSVVLRIIVIGWLLYYLVRLFRTG